MKATHASALPDLDSITSLATLGLVAYAIYKILPFLQKGKDETSDTIAKWWLALFPNPPAMQVLGNVVFPDGTFVALANLQPPKSDPNGNVFVTYNGHYYQLSPSDANGNWPATLVG